MDGSRPLSPVKLPKAGGTQCRLKGEIDPIGSVTVNGTLNCVGNEGHVRLFGGQVPEDIFPSQFDRENSQCNDYNGNVVLPVFGP